jgi:hypothetical protein
MKRLLAVALLIIGCDRSSSPLPSEPRFETTVTPGPGSPIASIQTMQIRFLDDPYSGQLCNGDVVLGTLMITDQFRFITYKNGTFEAVENYVGAAGTLFGSSGTTYLAMQANHSDNIFNVDGMPNTLDLTGTVRLMLVAVGTGANLINYQTFHFTFDPANGDFGTLTQTSSVRCPVP